MKNNDVIIHNFLDEKNEVVEEKETRSTLLEMLYDLSDALNNENNITIENTKDTEYIKYKGESYNRTYIIHK